LGISFVAHSPRGRRFLTGQIRMDQLSADDFRAKSSIRQWQL
jgi:aryl-alcohol dehydrogenase-like predicted oxidoreductase